MTAEQVQIRRDTATNLAAATPAQGELGFDTTNKRLVVGDGSRAGGWQIPNFHDIQNQAYTYAVAGGTANALTLAYGVPTISAADGLTLRFKATAGNTGSVTAAVDGRTAVTLKKIKGGAIVNLESGDLVSGGIYEMTYLSGSYIVTSLGQASGGESGLDLLAVATGGGSTYSFTSLDTDYKTIRFVLENLVPSSYASPYLAARVRKSGAGSFASADYYTRLTALGEDGDTYNADTSYIQLSHDSISTAYVTSGVSGELILTGFGQAKPCVLQGQTAWPQKAASSSSMYFHACAVAGALQTNLTDTIDAVQFFFTGVNIASGTIYAYGMRSAL